MVHTFTFATRLCILDEIDSISIHKALKPWRPNQIYPTFSTLPTPTAMDVFKQRCQPQENPLSIPMSLMHHHYSEGPMQSSIHFNYLTHMDQLKEKQEKFYAARHQRIQQQKGKLSTCSELPKCCERYIWACQRENPSLLPGASSGEVP